MLKPLPLELVRALRLTLLLAVVTGLAYPLFITAVGQLVFHDQANGSMVTDAHGKVVGSRLIGQQFADPKYFHGRPSAITTTTGSNGQPIAPSPDPYDAQNSMGSNAAPSNQCFIQGTKAPKEAKCSGDGVADRVDKVRSENGLAPNAKVPVDLVTSDFAGFDPDLSVASALLQVNRVADARGLDRAKVRALVDKHVQGRVLWIFGEPHVNVLELNLALDAM